MLQSRVSLLGTVARIFIALPSLVHFICSERILRIFLLRSCISAPESQILQLSITWLSLWVSPARKAKGRHPVSLLQVPSRHKVEAGRSDTTIRCFKMESFYHACREDPYFLNKNQRSCLVFPHLFSLERQNQQVKLSSILQTKFQVLRDKEIKRNVWKTHENTECVTTSNKALVTTVLHWNTDTTST